MIKKFATACALLFSLGLAHAATSCDDVQAKIVEKLDKKGVKNYTLEVVPKDKDTGELRVVGTCDGGKNKIVYKRK